MSEPDPDKPVEIRTLDELILPESWELIRKRLLKVFVEYRFEVLQSEFIDCTAGKGLRMSEAQLKSANEALRQCLGIAPVTASPLAHVECVTGTWLRTVCKLFARDPE